MSIETAYSPESMEVVNGRRVGYCPICHRELEEYDDFCPRCGTHITWGDHESTPLTIRNCREMIHFVKSYFCDEYGTTTLYFSVPPDVLIGDVGNNFRRVSCGAPRVFLCGGRKRNGVAGF